MSGFIERNRLLIEDKLSNDGLYSSLFLDPTYNERLFDDDILSLDPSILYSTTMLSEKIFLDVPNSTMRGYVRDLEGYLDVLEEPPRKKRLPYLSVFKIHMVLLTIKRGESLSSIKVRLGLKEINQNKKIENDEKSGSYREKYNSDNLDLIFGNLFNQMQQYQKHIDTQDQRIAVQFELKDLEKKVLAIEKERDTWIEEKELEKDKVIAKLEGELADLKVKVIDKKREIDLNEREIENIKNQITIHRLYRKLDLQTRAIVNKNDEVNKKTSGILSIFSKKPSIDFEKEIRVDEQEMKSDHIEAKLDASIIEKNEEIKTLKTEINEMLTIITQKSNFIIEVKEQDSYDIEDIEEYEKRISNLERSIVEKERLLADKVSSLNVKPLELNDLIESDE